MKIEKSITFVTDGTYIKVSTSSFESGKDCVTIENEDQQFAITFSVEEFETFLDLAREVLG